MSVVSCRQLVYFQSPLIECGSSLDQVLAPLGLQERDVLGDLTMRMEWETFLHFLDEVVGALGSVEAISQAMAGAISQTPGVLRRLSSRYLRPHPIYTLGAKWLGPSIFYGLSATVENLDGGVVQKIEIPKTLAPGTSAFFWMQHGILMGAPGLIGWREAHVDFEYGTYSGTYWISFNETSRDEVDCRPHANDEALVRNDVADLIALYPIGDFRGTSVADEASKGVTTAKVRHIIEESDLSQCPSAHEVSFALGMSERTLSRKLRSEGASYSSVRDEVRRLRSIELLEGGLAVDRLAKRVGFSDESAFRRAFRRWTGQPPGRFVGD